VNSSDFLQNCFKASRTAKTKSQFFCSASKNVHGPSAFSLLQPYGFPVKTSNLPGHDFETEIVSVKTGSVSGHHCGDYLNHS